MDTTYQLTSTSVLIVAPSSSRQQRLHDTLSGEIGSVLVQEDMPQSLSEIGPASSVVSTLVLSLDPVETYPTGLVRSIRDRWPWMSILLVDGPASVQMAKTTMRAGAEDYIVRDQSTAENISEAVLTSLRRRWRTEIGNVVYTCSVSEGKLVGSSDAMQPMLRRLGLAIENDLNVLLRGESGTGKTLTARAIHAQSSRGGAPMMQIDCRGLKSERARELFLGGGLSTDSGPEKRTDTTALRDLAGGTLVLDHVNELESEAQEVIAHAMDARDVASGNASEGQGGVQFVGIVSAPPSLEDVRSDLYHQLAELPISPPPLRDREGDVLPLARHFLEMYGDADRETEKEFSSEAKAALRDFSWPGNVRQLENVIKRSVCISTSATLERSDLLLPEEPEEQDRAAPSPRPDSVVREPDPERAAVSERELAEGRTSTSSSVSGLDGLSFGQEESIPSLEELKKRAVKRAYEEFDGDVDRAAVALDIGRSTMYRMLRRHDLRDDDS